MCAFRAVFALDSRLRGNGEKKREWRIFAVPVGSFSCGSGFSGFLHRLAGGNPAYKAHSAIPAQSLPLA
ncbi:MAG: hypothetical protein OXU61_12220 [Gammaproteobacteria bacterium]|nr:hypothetical protein [Gammaproteobacteria bacterium]